MILKVQETVHVLQIQYIDKVGDVLFQQDIQVPMIQKAQKPVEGPEDRRGSSDPIHWCLRRSRGKCQ